MNQADLQRYCKDNGVPCHMVGERLRVMDLSQLPDHMRAHFDGRGFIKSVHPEPASAAVEEEPVKVLKGKLPEDFPGHAALEAAGLSTYAKVRKELSADKPFDEVDGIGPATAEKIRSAMNESLEEEEDTE